MAELELKRIIEAMLFASDAPVATERIVEILGGPEGSPERTGRAEVNNALQELSAEYDSAERAITISKVAGGWQIYCRPEYLKYARDLHKGRIPPRLSQAALETIAIVAYKQPLVRAEIEGIRGVDSSGVLATLLKRNLVTIAGRAPGMGRALMYRTTKEFLRYFGLNTITDLPRLEEFAEVLGLAPGELQMTVEGAEHMANVAAGATADAGAATAAAGGADEAGADRTGTVAGVQVAADETAVTDPSVETSPTTEATRTDDAVTPAETPAAIVDETEGAHALGDAAIMQPIDEA